MRRTDACGRVTSQMSVHQEILEIRTREPGLLDVTSLVRAVVQRAGILVGLCNVFVEHTSASLVIQENADPAVLRDLIRWLSELAPGDARVGARRGGP